MSLTSLVELAQAIAAKEKTCSSTDALFHLMQVKDQNRKLCFATEEAKESTSKSKNDLEGAYTALQNLLYEKNHFENEITSCRGFQSKVNEAAAALMPEEEFLSAPQGQDFLREQEERTKQQGEGGGVPAVAGLSSEQTQQLLSRHELMKARLVHEGLQRKQLVKHLDQVRHMKNSLKESVGGQEQVLQDLQGSLKNLEATAEPMNKLISPSTASLRGKMNKLGELLPTPLYIIYSQLVAAREAQHINCNTSIAGSVDEAQHFAAAEAQEHQPDSTDDPYKAHPLGVELEVLREAPTSVAASSSATNPTATKPLARVLFQYLPALRVVTAHAAPPADNNLLKAMFPGDDGSCLPLEAAAHLQGPSLKFSASKPARPYRWCQHLAGLDFVPTLPMLAAHLREHEQAAVLSGLEQYRRQGRVVTVVQRLWDLKQGDVRLGYIIGNLLKNLPLPSLTHVYPKTPLSLVVAKEEIKEKEDAAGATPTPIQARRKPSPVRAPPPPQAQQQQSQQTSNGMAPAQQEDEQMGEQQGAAAGSEGGAGAVQGSADEEPMVDEEGAIIEGGEQVAGHQQQEGEGGTPPPAGRWKRGREDASALVAALLREGEEEESRQAEAAAAPARQKPPSRLFRLVLRSQLLEAEVHVRIFTDYLLRPPQFQVQALRQLPAAATAAMDTLLTSKNSPSASKAAAAAGVPAGSSLGGAVANSIAWVEQQVNIEALKFVPPEHVTDTLTYQLTHLKLCLDSVTGVHQAASVASKPLLCGRDRHPAAPTQLLL